MEFEHLGFIDEKGNEDFESDKVKEWAGSKERYELEEQNGSTQVKVTMDIADEYKDYFNETWPLALQKLKSISES